MEKHFLKLNAHFLRDFSYAKDDNLIKVLLMKYHCNNLCMREIRDSHPTLRIFRLCKASCESTSSVDIRNFLKENKPHISEGKLLLKKKSGSMLQKWLLIDSLDKKKAQLNEQLFFSHIFSLQNRSHVPSLDTTQQE